jgi:antitoxin HicB
MRSLDDYMSILYKMEIAPGGEESGFVASYSDLPGCVACADPAEKACENAEDAKRCRTEAACVLRSFHVLFAEMCFLEPPTGIFLD